MLLIGFEQTMIELRSNCCNGDFFFKDFYFAMPFLHFIILSPHFGTLQAGFYNALYACIHSIL